MTFSEWCAMQTTSDPRRVRALAMLANKPCDRLSAVEFAQEMQVLEQGWKTATTGLTADDMKAHALPHGGEL